MNGQDFFYVSMIISLLSLHIPRVFSLSMSLLCHMVPSLWADQSGSVVTGGGGGVDPKMVFSFILTTTQSFFSCP